MQESSVTRLLRRECGSVHKLGRTGCCPLKLGSIRTYSGIGKEPGGSFRALRKPFRCSSRRSSCWGRCQGIPLGHRGTEGVFNPACQLGPAACPRGLLWLGWGEFSCHRPGFGVCIGARCSVSLVLSCWLGLSHHPELSCSSPCSVDPAWGTAASCGEGWHLLGLGALHLF